MSGAALYAFEDFDAPPAQKAAAAAPDPRALERARADGVAEGRRLAAEAFAVSQQKLEEDRLAAETAALRAAADAFAALQASAETARQQVERATARLAGACLQRLVADWGEAEAPRRAAAFAREIAQAAADRPALQVRTGAKVAQIAHDALSQGRAAALQVSVDTSLAPFAIAADWEIGQAAYDAMAEVELLEDVIDRACAALMQENTP